MKIKSEKCNAIQISQVERTQCISRADANERTIEWTLKQKVSQWQRIFFKKKMKHRPKIFVLSAFMLFNNLSFTICHWVWYSYSAVGSNEKCYNSMHQIVANSTVLFSYTNQSQTIFPIFLLLPISTDVSFRLFFLAHAQ